MLRLAKLAGDRKEEGRALVRHFLRHADPLLRTGAIQCLELDGVANCRDEATLSLLKGMAANDPDEHIRKSAAAVLKSLQQMDKDLRAEEIRLKEMAANDPDAHVRQGAAAALESLQQMDKDLRAPETKK